MYKLLNIFIKTYCESNFCCSGAGMWTLVPACEASPPPAGYSLSYQGRIVPLKREYSEIFRSELFASSSLHQRNSAGFKLLRILVSTLPIDLNLKVVTFTR